MSAQVRFCKGLPICIKQAENIKQMSGTALSEDNAGSMAQVRDLNTQNISNKAESHQELMVALKAFNLLAGSSAPMMARNPRMNPDGILDEGSIVAAAFTQFTTVHQNLLNTVIGKSAVNSPLSGGEMIGVLDLLAFQPDLDPVQSTEDAAKAEADYSTLVELVNTFAGNLHTKIKEPWMAKWAQGFQSTLKETAAIIDNLGSYLQSATPDGIAGATTTQQREGMFTIVNGPSN
ncbi:hypothetical protein N7494_009438 [Penicillium frequentans]|uniref:Uncharacterized protein n=1 Tax=Penicillium frequentans TaxID=3151616 RepID=A0AAD6CPS2_9EURO|nr:hypothetical protein N7494_009438 [Penicillium glabrum]